MPLLPETLVQQIALTVVSALANQLLRGRPRTRIRCLRALSFGLLCAMWVIDIPSTALRLGAHSYIDSIALGQRQDDIVSERNAYRFSTTVYAAGRGANSGGSRSRPGRRGRGAGGKAAPSHPATAAHSRVRQDPIYRRRAISALHGLRNGGIPLGFANRQSFSAFGKQLHDGLREAGHQNAQGYLRGSSVTGISFKTGKPFDQGRRSDLDVAIVSPQLFERFASWSTKDDIRGGGTRSGPLSDGQLSRLGISRVQQSLRETSGRTVTLMLYKNIDALADRGAYRAVPR